MNHTMELQGVCIHLAMRGVIGIIYSASFCCDGGDGGGDGGGWYCNLFQKNVRLSHVECRMSLIHVDVRVCGEWSNYQKSFCLIVWLNLYPRRHK